MVFLIHIPLFSQEHVTIGKYKNFQSAKLGGEVSYLVHLADGYDAGLIAPCFNQNLVEAGHIKPVIDRAYSSEQIVEAHRYVGKGHKKGGAAITVCHNSN